MTGPATLGFGTATLGNLRREYTDCEAWELMERAWARGIRHFDTAPHYGLGLSERRVGAFLRTKPRADFVLTTKVGRLLVEGAGSNRRDPDFHVPASHERVWDPTPDGVRRSLHESLERLGMDRVDGLYLHDPDNYDLDASLDSAIPALVGLRDEGVVSVVGVGTNSTSAAEESLQRHGIDQVMIAGRLTLLEQSALSAVDECAERGVSVVAAAVFNSGLLATGRALSGTYDYGPAPADVVARTRRIAAVCEHHGVPVGAAAMAFPVRARAVSAVVVGAGSARHVDELADWWMLPIPDALWAELDSLRLVTFSPAD